MIKDLEGTFLAALEENQYKILRICSVYAEDSEDKKDLFQEVMINIWESTPTFSGKSSLSTWIFKITLNVCLRLQTKRAKLRKQFLDMDWISIDKIRDEETCNENHELLAQLRKCIQKLNDADKALITLHLEELPYREISAITGLTQNYVAVKLKRIRKKLWTCINRK